MPPPPHPSLFPKSFSLYDFWGLFLVILGFGKKKERKIDIRGKLEGICH
jgi:hypothetical protein